MSHLLDLDINCLASILSLLPIPDQLPTRLTCKSISYIVTSDNHLRLLCSLYGIPYSIYTAIDNKVILCDIMPKLGIIYYLSTVVDYYRLSSIACSLGDIDYALAHGGAHDYVLRYYVENKNETNAIAIMHTLGSIDGGYVSKTMLTTIGLAHKYRMTHLIRVMVKYIVVDESVIVDETATGISDICTVAFVAGLIGMLDELLSLSHDCLSLIPSIIKRVREGDSLRSCLPITIPNSYSYMSRSISSGHGLLYLIVNKLIIYESGIVHGDDVSAICGDPDYALTMVTALYDGTMRLPCVYDIVSTIVHKDGHKILRSILEGHDLADAPVIGSIARGIHKLLNRPTDILLYYNNCTGVVDVLVDMLGIGSFKRIMSYVDNRDETKDRLGNPLWWYITSVTSI